MSDVIKYLYSTIPHYIDTKIVENEKYKKALAKLCENGKELSSALSDEGNALLNNYLDTHNELLDIECYGYFDIGFRLGLKLMLEIMED